MSARRDPGNRPVESIVDRLDELTESETLTIGDLVSAFGPRGLAPLMMVPALLLVSPLSGIPFFSTVCGLLIALVALQLVLGARHLWLPGIILRRSIEGGRAHRAIPRLHKIAALIDRVAHRRLAFLLHPPLDRSPAALSGLAGLTVPFLELVPFSSTLLGTAVVLFSVSMITRDGLFLLAGLVVAAIALSIPLTVVAAVA